MSDGVIIAIITSATSILLSLITLAQAAAQKRQSKRSGVEARLDDIGKQLKAQSEKLDQQMARMDKLDAHNDLQYLSLLRLTVIDSDMPMSERLIAGKEYLSRGGNGDVKKFYEDLERQLNGKGA